jgi:hypothetical protein
MSVAIDSETNTAADKESFDRECAAETDESKLDTKCLCFIPITCL